MSNVTAVISAATTKVSPPLKVPGPSPQVGIHDPGFKKLTTAEKLNDGNYRKLIYQVYPDEPTCACAPLSNGVDVPKPSGNFLVCRSGCMGACCSSMRQSGVTSSTQDKANKDDKVAPFKPTYCVGNKRDNVRNVYDEDGTRRKAAHNGDYCCRNNRLRGGGEGGEERGDKGMYPQPGKVSGTMVRWSADAWNGRNDCAIERRLGGGGFEYVERRPLYRNPTSGPRVPCCDDENFYTRPPRANYPRDHPPDSNLDPGNFVLSMTNIDALTGNLYGSIPAGCCCPGKETLTRGTGDWGNGDYRSKKPFPMVDCLVKALRETQDFVNSLGKVPGLAGLGLMDPAESPYFGRARTKESEQGENKVAAKSSSPPGLPNPQCTGPCNARVMKSAFPRTDDPSANLSFATGIPGRGGVVREGVPSIPGPGLTYAMGKTRKKEDKDKSKEGEPSATAPVLIEPNPCGQPSCKSKLRKPEAAEDSSAVKVDETDQKKVTTLGNTRDGRLSRLSQNMKGMKKLHSGRRISPDVSGHGGDHTGRRRSSGRAGRLLMSFVYSAGDTYSGEARAHLNCVEERHRVPRNMGWLWNLNETVGRLKPRPGWRPGAIGRHLSELLRAAKAFSRAHRKRTKSSGSSSYRSRSRSTPSRGKRSKSPGDRKSVRRTQGKNRVDAKEETEPPPTLYIHRKDGTYYVTMYPIKQDTMDVPKLEEPMKPLQFKIAKNKDDGSIASSSTASDMEIEFSPPAAVNRYKKKSNVVHVDTQVKQQEINDAYRRDEAPKTKSKKKGKKSKK